MFKLKFFGAVASQRRDFLASRDFVRLPVWPEIDGELTQLADLSSRRRRPPGRVSVWRRAFGSVRRLIARTVLWNTALAIVLLAGVIASRYILLPGNSLKFVMSLAAVIFVGECIKHVVGYFDSLRRAQMARGIQMHLMNLVNDKLIHIDPSLSGDLSKGNLKTLISSDVESVEDFITAAVASWIPTAVLLLVLSPAIYWNAGMLGLAGVGVSLLQVPIAVYLARAIEKFKRRAQTQQDSLTTLIGEWVRNMRLVRFLGWQPSMRKEIAGRMRRYTIESALGHFLNCVTYGISSSWWMMPLISMLLLAWAADVPLNLPEFFASVWALNHLTNYIQHLPWGISMYAGAAAGAARIGRLLDAPDIDRHLMLCSPPPGSDLEPVRVHLKNVSLVIDERPIIKRLSLSLSLKQRTAIVGTVGSGKSILLELLIGERAPSEGEVEIEFASGVRANLWCEEVYHSFRAMAAYVPQQPYLSNTSLKNNISLDDAAPIGEVVAAAERAQLGPDVLLFPRGYDEEVGEIGINLSGGQKQRVSLARAFISRRSVFVLDDPLSAVDRETEKALMDNLLEFSKSIIMVSHRLEELSRCDRVIVLDSGTVVEDDTPERLMSDPQSAFSSFLSAIDDHEEAA